MRDDVTLVIDGTEYRGWQSVSITRGLEMLAATFTFGMADPRTSEAKPRPFAEYMAVEVFIGDDLVLTGVIDDIAPSYDQNQHTISISGRSLTGQLADNSAEAEAGEFRNVSLASVAKTLCRPFGVQVEISSAAASEPFDRVQIEAGETVAELLERLARQRGVFLTDDVRGNLVITRRGETVQDRIKQGVHEIISMKGGFKGTDRHSTVTVKGQRTGSDSWTASAAAAPVGRARDAGVPIHRPLVILSEIQGDHTALTDRAKYEVALRKGRSRRWTYELRGWRRRDRALWQSNELVSVVDPMVHLDADLLAVEVTSTLDRNGSRSELILAQPEGYDLRAVPETRAESTGWQS